MPGDPDTGGARSHQHHPLVGQLGSGRTTRRQDTGDDHRGGSLNIVVEAQQPVFVAIQQRERVDLLEVLPLEEGAGPATGDGVDELIHQLVVLLTAQARMAPPGV